MFGWNALAIMLKDTNNFTKGCGQGSKGTLEPIKATSCAFMTMASFKTSAWNASLHLSRISCSLASHRAWFKVSAAASNLACSGSPELLVCCGHAAILEDA